MRKLLPVLMVFGVFLGSAGESFALPECPGSPASSQPTTAVSWSDCFGTYYLFFPGNNPGNKYVGEWKNGRPHGQGTLTYANGDKYVGEYKDGDKHGQGTLTYANGGVKEGIFDNGWFKYTQKVTPTVNTKPLIIQ